MIRVLLAAAASGSGKTTVTCALLAALQKRRLNPCACKCGPDYIDPLFHRAVLGVESHNLDLFFTPEDTLWRLYARHIQGHGAVVCEGAMGYYDGVALTDRSSAWHVAQTLDLPTVLVVRPGGSSLTLAAQLRGLLAFRAQSRIVGILLNDCAPALSARLTPVLERETGLPVLGCLPRLPQGRFESRHLGLCTAAEIDDLSARLTLLGEALEQHADLDRLLALCDDGSGQPAAPVPAATKQRVKIAVARDKAFCFCYGETIRALQDAGAEVVYFSPLSDGALPQGVGGLYLPGGYPELYAEALSQNRALCAALGKAVADGLPTVAECGGFLYLGQTLEDADSDHAFPLVGALPGRGVKTPGLVRFGYANLTAQGDSLLLRTGETVPVHEFHHWDSTDNGAAFRLEKPASDRSWTGGFATPTLYAAFAHLYFAGHPVLAERFVAAAERRIHTHGTI